MVRIPLLNLQMEKLRLRKTERLAGGHTEIVVESTEASCVLRNLELI